VSGPRLTAEEVRLLADTRPAGIILFGRNIDNPAQLSALVGELRRVLPKHAVLMVDQEGGRVQRLRPPHWGGHPAVAAIGALHDRDPIAGKRAAWLQGALIGAEAATAGFDVVCAPVLDLLRPEGHGVIGDRAFGGDPHDVAALGAAMADGLLAAGVQPVAKHAPGHGRAGVDSHAVLPVVDGLDDADLAAFAPVSWMGWLMTAHVVYRSEDFRPATLSSHIIRHAIRGRLGFSGVLVSDDLNMGAISGPYPARVGAALAAGCDVALFCRGELEANRDVLAGCPELSAGAAARLAAARGMAERARCPLDVAAMRAERDICLG